MTINSISHGGASSATRLTTMTMAAFLAELQQLLYEERWMLLFLILLIIVDFRFGWGESHKRYKEAKEKHDEALAFNYKWHTSRAIRRTFNKFMDYISLTMLFTAFGLWALPPVGVDYIFGAYTACAIAFFCEIRSVGGHLLYLRGISVEKNTLMGYVKTFAVAIAKRKNEDIGCAMEETFDRMNDTSPGKPHKRRKQ